MTPSVIHQLVPFCLNVADSSPLCRVGLLLAKQASSEFHVVSLVRNKDHFKDVQDQGAHPQLLDLEHASVSELASAFQRSKAVVFSAGAGGKGGPEKTKAIDLLGAIKVSCRALLSSSTSHQTLEVGM